MCRYLGRRITCSPRTANSIVSSLLHHVAAFVGSRPELDLRTFDLHRQRAQLESMLAGAPGAPSALNLMNQTADPQAGLVITEAQVFQIETDYNAGRLNGGDQGVDPHTL